MAEALEMSPTSGHFRMLCGASIAYGLTEGGYNATQISLTPLAKRIVSPTDEGDDFRAKREATLRPKIIRDFLTKYNNSRLPSKQIACNVLEEMGVPQDKTKQTLELVLECARDVGFLRDFKGNFYVDLEQTAPSDGSLSPDEAVLSQKVDHNGNGHAASGAAPDVSTSLVHQAKPPSNRVFITHGKNKEIVSQIKELLTFGNFQPVVSMEQETVSKPVSDKVMDDMRSCSAAIVHVGMELKFLDGDGKEHRILNPNVLIEIGACMAL